MVEKYFTYSLHNIIVEKWNFKKKKCYIIITDLWCALKSYSVGLKKKKSKFMRKNYFILIVIYLLLYVKLLLYSACKLINT